MSGANLFRTDPDLSKMHSFFVVHISFYSFVEFLNNEMTKKSKIYFSNARVYAIAGYAIARVHFTTKRHAF